VKLIDVHYQEDYGHEWYLNLFCTRKFNLYQSEVRWSQYPCTPLILMNIFGESLFGFSISAYKLHLSFDLFAYYPRQLDEFRNYCGN
jgi:hypothetical protein